MTSHNTQNTDWYRRFIHEGGHVVASLALSLLIDLKKPADLVAMNFVDEYEERQDRARFTYNPGFDSMRSPLKQNPLQKAIALAAGGVAETRHFGGPPQGANKDLATLKLWMADPDLFPILDPEVNGGFPETNKLLQQHWESVVNIADKAFAIFKEKGLEVKTEFPLTVLLPESDLRAIFNDQSAQNKA